MRLHGPWGPGRDFDLHAEGSGGPWQSFKQSSDRI